MGNKLLMVWLSSCNNEKMQKKKKDAKITGTACLALLKPLTLSWRNGLKPKEAHLDKMEEKNCGMLLNVADAKDMFTLSHWPTPCLLPGS